MDDLIHKSAIVTGAAGGIGRAVAESLLRAGARVVLADINFERVKQVAQELGPNALPCHVDVANEDSVQEMVATTLEHFGSIDALVNNAAITANSSIPHGGQILEIPDDQWRKVLDVNLTGAFICSKYVGGEMAPAGKGVIVNMASIQGLYATRGGGDYGVSKAGVIMLTRVLAGELAELGIRVNAIAPGPIDTAPDAESNPARTSATLLGRPGLPREVADAVLFLVSDQSSFIHGEVLMIDGGAGVRFRESPKLERSRH